MKKITVEVKDDHLELLSRAKPMNAIAELIWNALDAEATEVRVDFVENEMQGLDMVRVSDNGHGLDYDEAFVVFQNLGGSWKREGMRTPNRGRTLHGKYGKGRFRAFALGSLVEWSSVFDSDAGHKHYNIVGRTSSLGEFELTEPAPCDEAHTGVTIAISNPPAKVGLLRGVKAMEEVTDIFALYMRKYPDVRIVYDGCPLDPTNSEHRHDDYDLGELVMENGERVRAELTVVEWNLPNKRGVILCDENGFGLRTLRPRPLFRGFSYTAYLRSAHFAALESQGLLELEEMASDMRQIIDAVRVQLRKHFTLREAELAQDLLVRWKQNGLYPYASEPADVAEESERRIFDIYATHLNQYPEFSDARHPSKRLILRFLQELVGADPTRAARIMDELLTMPEEKEEEIQELMQNQES